MIQKKSRNFKRNYLIGKGKFLMCPSNPETLGGYGFHFLHDLPKKGDRMTYISGLKDLIDIKKKYPKLEMVLHTDQGAVYASKSFNEILPLYNIIRSMSRAGTPTDNAAMEAINGWIKTEIFTDFHITSNEKIREEVASYISFYNEQRPAYSLNYLTPKQYREYFSNSMMIN